MVVESGMGNVGVLEVFLKIRTRQVLDMNSSEHRWRNLLEVLLFVDDLDTMFEVGRAVLADRGKVAVY